MTVSPAMPVSGPLITSHYLRDLIILALWVVLHDIYDKVSIYGVHNWLQRSTRAQLSRDMKHWFFALLSVQLSLLRPSVYLPSVIVRNAFSRALSPIRGEASLKNISRNKVSTWVALHILHSTLATELRARKRRQQVVSFSLQVFRFREF